MRINLWTEKVIHAETGALNGEIYAEMGAF